MSLQTFFILKITFIQIVAIFIITEIQLMGRYTLFELERLTGILAHTIRVWERRYGLMKPQRTETNRRWYDDDDLRRLINISNLYRAGMKISRIARLSEDELEEKAGMQNSDSAESDVQLNSLIVAMLSFNGNAVNEVLLRSIINTGFESTFTNVVFPFLKRVGIMWHTGAITAGTEHFMTVVFRARLISAIDSLPPPNDPKRKRFILFLPENELHELGLLFYSFLIRSAGHETLYLGQSTPFSVLPEACEKWLPDFLVTGSLSFLSVKEPEKYLSQMSSTFPSLKILVGGMLAEVPSAEKYRNIFPVRTAADLKQHF